MLQAIALLLTTSLTCVGLLAAWAATSPRHWFWRTGVFVAVLGLLLLIPAHEPFVAFALQGAVVAAGVQLNRQWRRRKEGDRDSPKRTRFSLATLLLLTVFVAIGAAVAVRVPTLNFQAWQSVVLIGVVSGMATLLVLWIVHGQLVCWWLRIAVGVVLSLSISLPLAGGDWFFLTAFNYPWPPPVRGSIWSRGIYGGYTEQSLISVWIPIISCSTLISSLVVWGLASLTVKTPESTAKGAGIFKSWKRVLSIFLLLSLSCAIVFPPAGVYYLLMRPLSIPQTVLPDPNGYDDVIAAGKMAVNWKYNAAAYGLGAAPIEEVREAVNEMEPVYERAAIGLAKEVQVPLDYQNDLYSNSDGYMDIRSLARAMSGRGWLAETEEQFQDAANYYLNVIKLGYATRRGGLIADAYVGGAISGVGRNSLFNLRNQISKEDCIELIATLSELERQCEVDEEFIFRDKIWRQHAKGWHGRFVDILGVMVYGDPYLSTEQFCYASQQVRAEMKLLCTELAIQAWRSTHHKLPDSLANLVPQYLSKIPIDPFAPDGALLQYRLTEDGYILYSVGYNGSDDGGAAPDEEDIGRFKTGDLRLDIRFAPEPEPVEDDDIEDENEISTEADERIDK